jgi:predicted small secreted protein
MLTEGGQQFQNAWANLYTELAANQPVTPQPFFEAALGGTGSAYCHGFSSCTAAVAYNENTVNGNIVGTSAVYDVWQDLSPSFVFGRSMASSPNCENTLVPSINSTTPVPVCQQVNSIGVNTSSGYGNYNGVFVSWRSNDFHGLTALSNLTYARALGTQGEVQATSEFTVEEPWNIHNGYGPQPFDYKFNYNLAMVYAPRIFKGQHSLAARMLGGWTIAPLFTAQSGAPLEVNTFQGAGEDCESFGEGDCNFEATNENAVFVSSAAISTARGAGNSVQNIGNVTNALGVAANGNPTNGGSGLNQFANPNAVYNAFRAPILGIDNNTGGQGVLRGLPTWNLDASISKNFQVTERFSVMFIFESTNILNHVEFNNPFLAIGDPGDFGVLDGAGGGQVNSPRSMQFGLRLHF